MLRLRHYAPILTLWFTACQQTPEAMQRADVLEMGSNYQASCRVLEAMPAPTEAAARLKKADPVFRSELIVATDRVAYMGTGPQQALGLGAYAADLAYANLYGHPLEATASLKALDDLALRMEVEDALGSTQLASDLSRGLASDSLLSRLNLGISAFNARLQARGQLPLSVLAVAGGWVEGMYLLCHHSEGGPLTGGLRSQAASQKPTLELLLTAWPQGGSPSSEQAQLYRLLREAKEALDATTSREVAIAGGGQWTERDGIDVFMPAYRTESNLRPIAFGRLCKAVYKARTLIERTGEHELAKATLALW